MTIDANLPVLILGSMAYDTIMVFDGRFKDQILADQVHILNVSFLVPTLRREWGGCAGNISYGLHCLGGQPLAMATLGSDGGDYVQRFTELGVDTRCLKTIPQAYTAQAFITNDLDDNQITAFHPGAMNYAHTQSVQEAGKVGLAILSPDGREAMLEHAEQLAEVQIPFIFDPGQGLPMFDGACLLHFMDLASYAVVNDYEGKMLSERTGLDLRQLAERVQALVVTRGAEGAWVFTHGECIEIPAVAASNIIDPTGCGDAFRAGMLYGLSHGWDWPSIGRLASVMGSLKISHRGGQRYQPTPDLVNATLVNAFGPSTLTIGG